MIGRREVLGTFVRLRALRGWEAGLALAGLGALSVWSMAPTYVVPALMIGLVGWIWALDSGSTLRPIRSGFWRGWTFGFGYFFASVWWTVNAFLVEGQSYVWLIWVPLIVFPAGLALFWGVVGALYRRLNLKGPLRVVIFVALMIVIEMTRSVVFSGFPWNLPGHVWAAGGVISQNAAFIGASGLSALTLFMLSAPAALWGGERLWMRVLPSACGVLILIGLVSFGAMRLAQAEDQALSETRLRLVHLDIPQSLKTYEHRFQLLERYLDHSFVPGYQDVDAIIWPEGAIPGFVLRDPDIGQRLREQTPDQTRLIIGTPRATTLDGRIDYYNSLVTLVKNDEKLHLEGVYDKVKLVPLGEGNPLITVTELLNFTSLSQNSPFYSSGKNASTLTLPGLPSFAPLICYEAIFPRFIPRGNDRPDWMLNISNDAWYGDSAGPKQLMTMTRYRAIEEGLAMVRSASSGVSGQIDGYGRMHDIAPDSSDGVLDFRLLEPLDETFYAVYGDWPWVSGIFGFLCALAGLFLGFKRR
ncbi:apolipoprotein N-acyltransferase [Woodsholea maritima]|uniref:apolipoprotein N-acyltransferase n=1 Tax=Woodsholea maritima TaxID=240237 RepID=UPI0003AAB2AB|nr:apolipoprotein N-acyltransferase [Woodsholea maritima]